jgi:hypothetical protein
MSGKWLIAAQQGACFLSEEVVLSPDRLTFP